MQVGKIQYANLGKKGVWQKTKNKMKNNDTKHVYLMLKDFPRLREWLFKSPMEIKQFLQNKHLQDEIKRLREEFSR